MTKSHKLEWVILLTSLILIYITYGFRVRKLIELILTWTFAFTGYNLLVEYGFMQSIERFWNNKNKT